MPKLKTQRCNLCGKRLSYPKWVKSRYTDNYYCIDRNVCARRAKKRKS